MKTDPRTNSDPHASVIGTPSARSSSVSSSSQIPSSSSRTPVMSAFQNIPGSPQIESTNTPGHAVVSCSNCFNCQNNAGPCTNDQPIYSYSSPEQMPLTSAPLLSLECMAPQIPTGFDTIIDQYMRSVLRPEAFVSSPQSIPSQSPGPMSPPYWSTNIDPQLPPLHSMVCSRLDSTQERK